MGSTNIIHNILMQYNYIIFIIVVIGFGISWDARVIRVEPQMKFNGYQRGYPNKRSLPAQDQTVDLQVSRQAK